MKRKMNDTRMRSIVRRDGGRLCLWLLIALFSALTGCQLAMPDAGEEEDRLIGVFVTRKYLDLFDFERYFNDNAWRFTGGEIVLDEPARQYEERIYAVLTSKTITSETGETAEFSEYVFEGLEGIPYFSAQMTLPDGQSYIALTGGEEISGGQSSVNVGDEEDSTALEGTIYISANAAEKSFYCNPVYQGADGRVYLTAGTGVSGDLSAGGSFAQSLDASATETIDGITKQRSFSIRIEIRAIAPPEKIVLMQMDESGALLSWEEFAPGALPQELSPRADAAFLIAQTVSEGSISHEIYDSASQSLDTFYVREDNICIKKSTQLSWAGARNGNASA